MSLYAEDASGATGPGWGGSALPPRYAERLARTVGASALTITDATSREVIDTAGGTPPAGSPELVADEPVMWAAPDGRRWFSVAAATGSAILHLQGPPGWRLDARRQVTLQVASRMLATLRDSRGDAAPPLLEALCAERTLAEMALDVQTHAEGIRRVADIEPETRPRSAEAGLTRVVTPVATDVVAVVTALVAPLLDAATVGIDVLQPERRLLEPLPGSFGAADEAIMSARLPASEVPDLMAGVTDGARGSFDNAVATRSTAWRRRFAAMGVEQMLSVPMQAPDGRTIGLVHVANHRIAFADSDLRRLRPTVAAIAGMVERIRDRRDMMTREALSASVAQVATAIAYGRPIARLARLLEALCRDVRAQMLVVSFKDEGPALQVMHGDLPSTVADAFVAASARGNVALRRSMSPPRPGDSAGSCALHIPVFVAGQLTGTLSVLRVPYERFATHEENALRRTGELLSLARTTENYHREHVEMARLRERQRIADDLHDHVAQVLFSGQLALQEVMERVDADSAILPSLARAQDRLVRGQSAMKEVIEQLSESATASVAARLTAVVHAVEDEFERLIETEIAGSAAEAAEGLTEGEAEALLRAAREGLVNAAKHAGPCDIRLRLRLAAGERLLLVVDDAGVGLPAEGTSGYGLTALRRRARAHGGALRLGANQRGGVRLTLSFPVREPGRIH